MATAPVSTCTLESGYGAYPDRVSAVDGTDVVLDVLERNAVDQTADNQCVRDRVRERKVVVVEEPRVSIRFFCQLFRIPGVQRREYHIYLRGLRGDGIATDFGMVPTSTFIAVCPGLTHRLVGIEPGVARPV